MIVWDSLDWTMQAYERNWDASLHVDPQQEIKLSHSQNEVSIQYLASDKEVKKINSMKVNTYFYTYSWLVNALLLRDSVEFSLQCVFAAVGKGIYVYNLQMKCVIAFQRTAHDSTVLHISKLPNRCTLHYIFMH